MKYLIFLLPIFVFGAENAEKNYDIVARTINFLIFAGILYYFIANPIKNAYKSRIESIEKKMAQTRNKIAQAQEKEEIAKAKVEETRAVAEKFIEAGRIEARQLASKIEKDAWSTVKFMSENHIDQKEYTRRASIKKAVESVISEVIEDDSIKLSEQNLVELMTKKVS